MGFVSNEEQDQPGHPLHCPHEESDYPKLPIPNQTHSKDSGQTADWRMITVKTEKLSDNLYLSCYDIFNYNTNIDLVNDDVYTKFGLILSFRSQDIE